MKKLIQKISSVTLLLVSVVTLNAQNVGINATGAAPSGDAMLDIAAIDKGLLVPRVNIANLATIAPITGGTTTSLLVYNTNATTGLGYYYWDGAAWVKFTTGGDDWKIIGNANITGGTHFLGTTNNVQLDFRTSNTTRFSVKSNGHQVFAGGDGTNALPFYSWSSDPDIGMYRVTTNTLGFSTAAVERFRMSTTEAVFNDISANYDFRVESNGQANMFFVDAGNDRIGIGTAAPTTDLHMTTNVASGYMAWFENTAGAASSLIAYNTSTQNALGGATNLATGIGAYGVALQATGTSYAIYGVSNSSNSLGVRGSIPTTGTWTGYGGLFTGGLGYVNGLYNLSDERVKKDIEVISGAVDKLKKIKGVSYKYNLEKYSYLASGDTRTYLGFLAQDVQKIFPEAVSQKEMVVDGPSEMGVSADMSKFQMEIFNVVDYTAIVPVTVEAIKEQQIMIEALNSRIEALEKMVLELKNK